MKLISASPQLLGKVRRFPRSVRDVYGRGPNSFTNLSVYAFGLSAIWIPVNTVLLQFRVLDIADEDQKNGMLGAIALVGLVVAAFSQPLMGAISDKTNSRWGKRVPYIVLGDLGLIAVVPLLAIVNSFLGLLLAIAAIQLFIHVSQGPANALLIDHVPSDKRGAGAGPLNLARVVGGLHHRSRDASHEQIRYRGRRVGLVLVVDRPRDLNTCVYNALDVWFIASA
jgi:hypothetical protein